MQRDAVRRVKEMQQRAQQTLNSANAAIPAQPQHPPKQEGHPSGRGGHTGDGPGHPGPPPQQPHEPEGSTALSPVLDNMTRPFNLKGVLDALGLDTEQLIILGLLLILLSEGADKTLILALCYLLI